MLIESEGKQTFLIDNGYTLFSTFFEEFFYCLVTPFRIPGLWLDRFQLKNWQKLTVILWKGTIEQIGI